VDNTLSFSANINAVIHSCKFMHYNILKVWPLLTQEAAQVLIKAFCWLDSLLVPVDHCNLSRTLQPAWCSTFKSNQIKTNCICHIHMVSR
jgi:hypothetical protein